MKNSIFSTLCNLKLFFCYSLELRLSSEIWVEIARDGCMNHARDGCMNHVVWANNKITRDILYISDFINNDNSLMTYSQFRNK